MKPESIARQAEKCPNQKARLILLLTGFILAAPSLIIFSNLIYLNWKTPRLATATSSLPPAADFANYWCASLLSWMGKSSEAYNIFQLHNLELNIFGLSNHYGCGFYYPPTFLLLILPLGLIAYIPAFLLWIGITLSGYLIVIRKIKPDPLVLFLSLAFPGALVNILYGQNGFLSASLLGGGLLMLPNFPILAGFLIGCLSYKPHFVILSFFALATGRYWRALLSAIITTLALAFSSLIIFDFKTWLAFFSVISIPMHLLEMGYASWKIIPSFFSAVLSLGYGVQIAYIVQFFIMILVVGTVGWVWYGKNDLAMKNVLLVLATLLFTPYLFVYDLPMLAFPLAWLWEQSLIKGKITGERFLLCLAWLMPLGTILIWNLKIIDQAKVQIGPVVILACFLAALVRLKKFK